MEPLHLSPEPDGVSSFGPSQGVRICPPRIMAAPGRGKVAPAAAPDVDPACNRKARVAESYDSRNSVRLRVELNQLVFQFIAIDRVVVRIIGVGFRTRQS